MKKVLFCAMFLFATNSFADGHYAGIKVESRDGREGTSDSTTVGVVFGKKFTESLSAEFSTRAKFDEGQDSNNSRFEGAVLTSMPLVSNLSVYTRTALGQKFISGDQYGYWSLEPGLKLNISPDWAIKTGIRFRDSFDTKFDESTRTYRVGLEYSMTKETSLSLNVDRQKGESEHQALGVGITHKF